MCGCPCRQRPATEHPNQGDVLCHRQSGLTLLEILVVGVIVAMILALGLPALARARQSTDRLQCANHLRQIAAAGQLYAADHRLYLGQASALDYQSPASEPSETSLAHNGRPLAGFLINAGFNHPRTRQPDHYLALSYLPLGTTDRGQPGSQVFICPRLRRQFTDLSDRHWQGVGNVESHYFLSTLLNAPTQRDSLRQVRNNVWGPYRSDRIKRPDATILAGDALVMEPDAAFPLTDPRPATADIYNYDSIGGASTMFGVSNQPTRSWQSQSAPWHVGGPNALHFDGHVQVIEPPDDTHRHRLRPHFTANFSDQRN